MRVLLERDPTPAEASIARFALATSILHELGHAIFSSRRRDYTMDTTPEAYMGEEQIRELGFSFDNHIFGGIKSSSRLPFVRGEEPGGWIMSFVQLEFPNVKTFRGYNQEPRDAWDLVPYGIQPSPSWIVPTFVCSSLFTENYWDSVVNKKGTDALKLSRFHAESGILTMESPRVDEVQTMLTQVRNAIDARTQQIENMLKAVNPDIEGQQKIWARSLWGYEYLRHVIALFGLYHGHHNLHQCRRIAQGVVNAARSRLYPEDDEPEVLSRVVRSGCWIILALGYL
ncbi:uncharacterized protein PG998_000353 [Apiospora kogelbergensis]|uniref:Uncharacterized protein n=1 Tax=Apiospora kogelbergensis TaxID=1337665 RepID=A0AAW0QXH8_9PEZI